MKTPDVLMRAQNFARKIQASNEIREPYNSLLNIEMDKRDIHRLDLDNKPLLFDICKSATTSTEQALVLLDELHTYRLKCMGIVMDD